MELLKLNQYCQMIRYFGPRWLLDRALYSVRLKTGSARRQMPAHEWNDRPLSSFLSDAQLGSPTAYFHYRHQLRSQFLFDPDDREEYRPLLNQWKSENESSVKLSDDLNAGRFRFFSHESIDVGVPPRWHTDPFSGNQFPQKRHWSQIADFAGGDIKLAWELSRFSFVYGLVRAAWRTGDDRYADLFWDLIDDWKLSNSPGQGVNWKCGQEISLRVMAWCFGLYGFANSKATTPERVSSLAQMIAVSGCRIEGNLSYAVNQRNNHGISEAMGLWTIGTLFPEFGSAERWARRGRRLLESQARELVYDDGAFSQHSMNYHRVMLQAYLWVIQLGVVCNQPFSPELCQRIGNAGEFLYQVQDDASGRVPCYGQDDGALILPLNDCGYHDYRPLVQAAHYSTSETRRLNCGPWDEDLLWLFGPRALSGPVESTRRCDAKMPIGGYHTLRSRNGFVFTRASEFLHRPAQADMLHVDIWWRGENVAIDPGTYSYNSPPPWDNSLAETKYHNTVTVDGLNQMERASRFVWLPWIKGSSLGHHVSSQGQLACWQGTHNGYSRLRDPVSYRRSIIRMGDDHWLIVDVLRGLDPHDFCLHWLLPDYPVVVEPSTGHISLQTNSGRYSTIVSSSIDAELSVCRADPASPRGWRASYYHDREPALAILLQGRSAEVTFASLFGPDSSSLQLTGDEISVGGSGWAATVRMIPDEAGFKSIYEIQTTGAFVDALKTL